MMWSERLALAAEQSTLRVARHSQALVIVLVERLARDGETQRPRVLGRLWRVQLDLAERVLGEPTRIVDAPYAHWQHLLALHREFASRLIEAIETRELPVPGSQLAANVVPLVQRSGA
jgi:hypothetical protein